MAIKNTADLFNAIVAGGVAIVGVNSDGIVQPANLQSAAQSIINAFDDSVSAQAARVVVQDRATLVAMLANGNIEAKLMRALMLVLLDEFNSHALKINAILDAVDGATTLANLKTAVAAIADYPQRTKANLITGLTNKINAGSADA